MLVVGFSTVTSAHPTTEEDQVDERYYGSYMPYGPANLVGSFNYGTGHLRRRQVTFPVSDPNGPASKIGNATPVPTIMPTATDSGATAFCQCAALCSVAVRDAMAALNLNAAIPI